MHVLLDLRGLVLLSYHSGSDMDARRNAEGETFNTASHGFQNFLKFFMDPILEHYKPHQIIAVIDGSNDRRKFLYDGYKAKRKAKEKDPILVEETDALEEGVKQFLLSLGCTLVRNASTEADDMIAYLVKTLDGPKVIYTVDGDLSQLADERERVFVLLNGNPVEDSYKGVPSSLVPLWKSIVGDASDEYPGIKGMGQAAWEKLVEEFGMDGMVQLQYAVENADFSVIETALAEADNKQLRKLYEERSTWGNMYRLAQLHPEWCYGAFQSKIVTPTWVRRVPSSERMDKALEVMKSPFVKEKYERWLPTRWVIDAENFNPETDLAEFAGLVATSPCISFDFETDDCLKHPAYQTARANYVDVLSQRLTGMSMTFGDNLQYTFYLPINHKDAKNLPAEVVLDFLGAIPANVPIVAHNANFELTVLAVQLQAYPDLVHDTLVMASYVDENEEGGLKKLSKTYLNYDQLDYQTVTQGRAMSELTVDEVVIYGQDDAIVTAHLWILFKDILQSEGTWKFVLENEFDVAYPLMDAFIEGVNVDWDKLTFLEEADGVEFDKMRAELIEILSTHCTEFNEAGFKVLMQEVYEFKKRVWTKIDGKTEEEIKDRLAQLEVDLRAAAKFNPPSPDPKYTENPLSNHSLSKVSQSLGFPAIRSADPKKLKAWVDSIQKQIDENGFVMEGRAAEFLVKLQMAIPNFKGEEEDSQRQELAAFCVEILSHDPTTYVGDELNVDSAPQMIQLLYGKMGLPILIRGNYDEDSQRAKVEMEPPPSTDTIALQTLLAELEEGSWQKRVLTLITDLRHILTRRELYYTPWPLWKSPVDGRMHPQIKNCGTITRRPSGNSPNLLQVSKVKDGGKVRTCILPRNPNEVVVSIDFSQQELMLLAADSKDPNLLACYQGANKKDVHTLTASGLAKEEYEPFLAKVKKKDPVAKKIRDKIAKVVNFLTSYGGTAAGLSRKAIIPRKQAEEFLERFFRTYPEVKKYQQAMIAFAERHGYVKDCFGNRKHCWLILAKDRAVKGAIERQAINYPIQGGAASVLKKVLRDVRQQGVFQKTGGVLIAPVYDELAASIPKDKVWEYLEMVLPIMEIVIPNSDLRLVADVSLGRSWGEQIELGPRPAKKDVDDAIQQASK